MARYLIEDNTKKAPKMIDFESSETTARVLCVFQTLIKQYTLKSEEENVNLMMSVSKVI